MARKKVETAAIKPEVDDRVFATVINGTLNVRKDASTKHAPIGELPDGSRVEILDIKGDWCKIKGGYVMRKFLDFK